MNDKQFYETKLQALLEAWDVEITCLEARAESAHSTMRDAARDKITELRARRKLVSEKAELLKHSSDESWLESKTDAVVAAEAMAHALRSIRARL